MAPPAGDGVLKLMSLQGPSHIQATAALGLPATVSHVLATLRSSCSVMLSPPSSHVQWIIKTMFTVSAPMLSVWEMAVCRGLLRTTWKM